MVDQVHPPLVRPGYLCRRAWRLWTVSTPDRASYNNVAVARAAARRALRRGFGDRALSAPQSLATLAARGHLACERTSIIFQSLSNGCKSHLDGLAALRVRIGRGQQRGSNNCVERCFR